MSRQILPCGMPHPYQWAPSLSNKLMPMVVLSLLNVITAMPTLPGSFSFLSLSPPSFFSFYYFFAIFLGGLLMIVFKKNRVSELLQWDNQQQPDGANGIPPSESSPSSSSSPQPQRRESSKYVSFLLFHSLPFF